MPEDNQTNSTDQPSDISSDRPDFSAAPPSRFHRPSPSVPNGAASASDPSVSSGVPVTPSMPPVSSDLPANPSIAQTNTEPVSVSTSPSAGQSFAPSEPTADEGHIISAEGLGGKTATIGHDENVALVATLGVPAPVQRKKSWLKLVVIGLVVSLVLSGIGYAAYNYMVLEPQSALSNYIGKIARSKTATFALTAVPKNAPKSDVKCDDSPYSGACAPPASDNNWKLSAKGVYDINSLKDPKFDVSGSLTMDNVSYGADARLLNKIFFFKIGDIGALGAELPLTKDWYKIKLDEEELTKEATKCLTDANSDQVVNQALWVNFPVKNTKRLSMSEQINGRPTAHFSGEIDFAQLQKRIAEANKKLSADCKIDIQPDDYANAEVKYDLYTSADYDRIVVTFKDTKTKDATELTLDMSDYNKPVKIEEPANAKDIEELTGESNDSGQQSTAPDGERNDQRQADINLIVNAVYQYSIDNNGNYPASVTTKPTAICKTDAKCSSLVDLSVLTKDGRYLISIPVDPKATGQYSTGYEISKDANGRVTVSAPLAEAGKKVTVTR